MTVFYFRERGQFIAVLTEQAWSIKDLLYGLKENFFAGFVTREIPSVWVEIVPS